MAATHTYVVTSNSYVPGPPDPVVTIVGTVDTIPSGPKGPIQVVVELWKSAYDQAAAQGIPALEALVGPLMLAQYNIALPPALAAPVNQVTGTFTL